MKAPFFLSLKYWKHNWKLILTGWMSPFLTCLGGIWLLIEMISYFSDAFKIRTQGQSLLLLVHIGLAAAVGFIQLAIKCKKNLSISHNLQGMDVSIEIRVGDIFHCQGSFIISTNSTFDTDMSQGLISEMSLQGQATKQFYDKVEHLDRDLEEALKHESPSPNQEEIGETKRVKIGGKTKSYDLGTVARVSPQGQVIYFVAIAKMNKAGVAEGFFKDMPEILGKLWYHIGNHGGLDPLIIPVLGTGHARMKVSREEMIREIIKSFIAACAEKNSLKN